MVALIEQVRDAARNTYAWPGGYRQWLLMADGECICPKCARKEWRQVARATKADPSTWPDEQWRVVDGFVNWDGPAIECAHCGVSHESEYGDTE